MDLALSMIRSSSRSQDAPDQNKIKWGEPERVWICILSDHPQITPLVPYSSLLTMILKGNKPFAWSGKINRSMSGLAGDRPRPMMQSQREL